MAPLWGRGRQRHGDRTLRHPEQVPRAHDASALCPRLHGRRSRTTRRSAPYQLLIVGDPLCRPWANIPEITVTGLTADETVHDELKVKPQARFAAGLEVEHFEMILDGLKVRQCPPDGCSQSIPARLPTGPTSSAWWP